MAVNEEKGGQEFANQDKAVVDSEGNVFGLQGVDIPERPADLLSKLDEAQRNARDLDKYGGATVWICDEGYDKCGHVANNGHHQGTNYISHEYLLSELEAGTATMKGDWTISQIKGMFEAAGAEGYVPNVDAEWKKWHGK
jgi:hypothetical protein